jgi:hypothetical protein
MSDFIEVAKSLVENRIAFGVHYSGDTPVIVITESLNNQQLQVAVHWGGHLSPDGTVAILCKELS